MIQNNAQDRVLNEKKKKKAVEMYEEYDLFTYKYMLAFI